LSHPNKKKQRENRAIKRLEEETTILGMAERGLKMQRKREVEYGWQYVYGDTKKLDKTPFETIYNRK